MFFTVIGLNSLFLMLGHFLRAPRENGFGEEEFRVYPMKKRKTGALYRTEPGNLFFGR